MGKRDGVRPVARGMAAFLVVVSVFQMRPATGAPGDIFAIPAPQIGADPPKATDIKQGDASAVRELLRCGTDVNARDRYGQTGLMLAAHAGHREIVEMLLDHGADLNVTAKFGLSALMLAVLGGHVEVARLLARAGADLSLKGTGAPGFAGKTARDLAAERGMQELGTELEPKP